MSMLTLNTLTLCYWDIIMFLSKQHNVGVIEWTQTTHPGTPPSNTSNQTQKFIPDHLILTKTLTVSEPMASQGLYEHAPKTHPVLKCVVQQPETIPESDDVVEIEEGAIPMEVENQLMNIEFAHAKSTPIQLYTCHCNTK